MNTERITTVLSPALTYDLIDLDVARDELKIASNDTSNDAFISRGISQVSRVVANFCNRILVAETVQDIIYPYRDAYPHQVPGGVEKILLSRYPVITLTSVTITDGGGTVTPLVQDTDFRLDADAGQLVRLNTASGYPVRWEPIMTTVVYTAGYDPIPPDLQDVTLRLLTARFYQRGRDPTLRSQDQPGIGSRTYWVGGVPGVKGPYPEDVLALIDQYRVPVVA